MKTRFWTAGGTEDRADVNDSVSRCAERVRKDQKSVIK